MLDKLKKSLILNFLSLLGFVISFSWLYQFLTFGHAQHNWLNHPTFTLFILVKQYLLVFILVLLFGIEMLFKKYANIKLEIAFDNKFYNFIFKTGLLFAILPLVCVGIIITRALFRNN